MTEVKEVAEGKKDVTIRGLDSELYRRASEIAKRMGVSVGEVFNEALRTFIAIVDGVTSAFEPIAQGIGGGISRVISRETVPIAGLDELEVNDRDFEELGKKVIFSDIGRLTLNVSKENFERYVVLIKECEEVVIPQTIPKLLVLSRARGVKRLVQMNR